VQFVFAEHTLDTDRRELCRGPDPVAVEPQVFDLLVYLLENRDRVVSKDDLIASVWGGRIVSDSTLTSRVNAARKAVGDSGEDQRLIRTIARKGLRFVGVVRSQPGIDNPLNAGGAGLNEIRRQSRAALSLPDRPAIAVLPFTNMSGDPDQEFFSDGISEDIITALCKSRWLFVIARNSSFIYKGKSVHMKQIAEELGVGYVVEGSVRKSGDRVRITAQLNDVTTGSHIWAQRYDRALADVFVVQDEITESIVGAVHPSLLQAEIERTKRKHPESLGAYECVLRAYPYFWAFDRAVNAMALAHLNRAIELEPDYPLARALAAWCKAREVIYNWTPKLDDAKVEALRLAKLAGDLTNDDPMVLTALSAAHSVVGDLEIASALIEKALALDPNSAMAWNRSGWLNAFLVRPEIAIEHFQRAIRLSPFDPMNFNSYFGIRNAHFVAGRYEESLEWCRKGMVERPELVWPLRSMAASLGLLGRIPEAREAVRRLLEGYPGITISKVVAATPHRGDYVQRYAEGLRKAGMPE
jgi:adenylate cyclase